MGISCKRQRNTTWSVTLSGKYLNSTLPYFTQTGATYDENSNWHKHVELWAKSMKVSVGNFGRRIPCATSTKILAASDMCVPQAMAQFVLKIEKLSLILEMARAYGFRPWLWLLPCANTTVRGEIKIHRHTMPLCVYFVNIIVGETIYTTFLAASRTTKQIPKIFGIF